jgi:hypothetical protein
MDMSKKLKDLQTAKTKENIKEALCMLPAFVGMSGAGICFFQWLSGQGDGYLKSTVFCLGASAILLWFYGGVIGQIHNKNAKEIQKKIDNIKASMNQRGC